MSLMAIVIQTEADIDHHSGSMRGHIVLIRIRVCHCEEPRRRRTQDPGGAVLWLHHGLHLFSGKQQMPLWKMSVLCIISRQLINGKQAPEEGKINMQIILPGFSHCFKKNKKVSQIFYFNMPKCYYVFVPSLFFFLKTTELYSMKEGLNSQLVHKP